jgi:ABC-type glutathione transport system ATPase component
VTVETVPQTLLEAEGLQVRLGGRTLLHEIGLRLGKGEALAIVGEAGSGKSILAQSLAAMLPEGARVDGRLLLGGALYPSDERGRAAWRGKRIAYLSATVRRPLEALLAQKPEVLICDEVTANLDPSEQRDLLGAIVAQCRMAGISLVVLSRDIRLGAAVAPRLAVLSEGRIVEDGPTSEVSERPRHEATQRLVAAERPRTRTLMRPPIGEPLLEVNGLSKRFGANALLRQAGKTALSGVSFSVRRGEAVGLVGAAGSGKSTLLRLVAGLGRASIGHMLFNRERYRGSDLTPEGLAGISFVFPDPRGAFNPDLPIGVSMTEPLRLEQQLLVEEQADRLVEALRVVELGPWVLGELPGAFSVLELQRLALARAMVGRPKLMVLDEPTAEMDPVARSAFLVLFNRVRADQGLTVLFGSRDFEVIRQVADRTLVIDAGQIVEGGKPGQLAEAPQHAATARLVAARYPDPYVPPPVVEPPAVVEAPVVSETAVAAEEAIAAISAAIPAEALAAVAPETEVTPEVTVAVSEEAATETVPGPEPEPEPVPEPLAAAAAEPVPVPEPDPVPVPIPVAEPVVVAEAPSPGEDTPAPEAAPEVATPSVEAADEHAKGGKADDAVERLDGDAGRARRVTGNSEWEGDLN